MGLPQFYFLVVELVSQFYSIDQAIIRLIVQLMIHFTVATIKVFRLRKNWIVCFSANQIRENNE